MSIPIRWKGPRALRDRPESRTVSFLELFYDLVFVVLVAAIAHDFAAHPDLHGVLQYLFLFSIVWWSWANGSIYHDLHGGDDARTRVFTFLQMLAVGGMATFVHDAFGDGATGFAVSYATLHAVLTWLWFSTGRYDPEHAVVSRPYAAAFAITTVLFGISVLVPPPFRYALWILSLGIDITIPLLVGRARQPEARKVIERSRQVTHSLAERFGLFTIIVLGEITVSAIGGLRSAYGLTSHGLMTYLGGMGLGISVWWFYFDAVGLRPPRKRAIPWMFAHLLLGMGIAGVGAALGAIGHTLSDPSFNHGGTDIGVRWMLAASVATTLTALSVLVATVADDNPPRPTAEIAIVLLMAILALISGWLPVESPTLAAVLVVLVVTPSVARLIGPQTEKA